MSSYSLTENQMDGGSNTAVHYNYVGGSFWPIDGLSFDPSLEFMQTQDNRSHYLTETLTANLGLNYSIWDRSLKIFLNGYHSNSHDSDGYLDAQDIGVSLGIERDLKEILGLPHSDQKIILKMNHYSYRDFIYSTSSSSESSALLLFKLTP